MDASIGGVLGRHAELHSIAVLDRHGRPLTAGEGDLQLQSVGGSVQVRPASALALSVGIVVAAQADGSFKDEIVPVTVSSRKGDVSYDTDEQPGRIQTDKIPTLRAAFGKEGVLTDAVSSRIIRQAIVPRFKAGDIAGGVAAGADDLIALLQLPPEEQAAFAAQAKAASADAGDSPGWGALVWLIIIIVWIIIASRRGSRGRRAPG